MAGHGRKQRCEARISLRGQKNPGCRLWVHNPSVWRQLHRCTQGLRTGLAGSGWCEVEGNDLGTQGSGSYVGVVMEVSGWSPTPSFSQQSQLCWLGEIAARDLTHIQTDPREELQVQGWGGRLWDEAVRVCVHWMCARPSQSAPITHTDTHTNWRKGFRGAQQQGTSRDRQALTAPAQ